MEQLLPPLVPEGFSDQLPRSTPPAENCAACGAFVGMRSALLRSKCEQRDDEGVASQWI